MAAWTAFLQAHAAVIHTLERELRAEADLPLTWYDVLVHLHRAPERRLRMSDLAQAVVLSRSGITRLIDQMERAGLVERVSCPSDRRGLFAALTDAGGETLRRAAPIHLRGVAEHFTELLDEEDAATLAQVLGRVRDASRGAVTA
ncbi:MAG TPA: MarR family transcriptional regulator [Egibacteraceae bacterium]|nr:MarR family transcriptional regulator [Egibacteraceae bacterium]